VKKKVRNVPGGTKRECAACPQFPLCENPPELRLKVSFGPGVGRRTVRICRRCAELSFGTGKDGPVSHE